MAKKPVAAAAHRRNGKSRQAKKPGRDLLSREAAAGAYSKISSAAKSAYLSLPALPLLDRATSAILIFCILAYLAITAYVFVTTPAPEIRFDIVEEGLGGLRAVALEPGEAYSYLLSSPDGESTISYSVKTAPPCSGVVVAESVDGRQSAEVCMENAIAPGSGLMFGNETIVLSSPWMLALTENFSWRVRGISSAGAYSAETPLEYRVERMGKAAGRDAYVVSFRDLSTGEGGITYYVDAEKRVLLLFDAGNVTLRMTSAPFALDWSQQD